MMHGDSSGRRRTLPLGSTGSWETAGKGFITERTPAEGLALRGAGQGHTGVLPLPGQRDGVVGKWQQASFRRDTQEATLNEPHLLRVRFDLFLRPRRINSDLIGFGAGHQGCQVGVPPPRPAPLHRMSSVCPE